MFDTTDSEVYTLKLFDMGGQEVFTECSDSIEDGYSQNLNLAGFHKGYPLHCGQF